MKYNKVGLDLIAKSISEYFELDLSDMFSKTRKRKNVLARQWFHFLSKELNDNITLDEIGRYGKFKYGYINDHSTVYYSINKMKGLLEIYEEERIAKKQLNYLIMRSLNFKRSSPNAICNTFPIEIFTLTKNNFTNHDKRSVC